MKSNLRIFVILVIVTVFTFLLWKMQEGTNGDLSSEATTNFAIADTSLVTKIFIAGTNGESVLLERRSDTRFWTLNGKHLARKDATDLLLKSFARAEVKGAVPELKRSTVIRNLSGSGKKVEIYLGDDKLDKTWYIGTATPSHTGTYMLLETPEEGKSQEPFIVHLEGFVEYLSKSLLNHLPCLIQKNKKTLKLLILLLKIQANILLIIFFYPYYKYKNY